ncbi:acyl-CoA desaturase [uncultured Corynebacterium sp.]|uniref:fatty acid desaturase family protein n=1 Tax=uncultured Corynebacterium sp. TaxID=159447 RepID=UPI0026026BC8|nr:acyl-CoA desaturase [uncultured Corynebacterium sp.]
MAISDIKAYSHLSEEDVAEIGRRFEAIAEEHRAALGPKDARYIRTLIRVQRILEVTGRGLLVLPTIGMALDKAGYKTRKGGLLPRSLRTPAHKGLWWAGVSTLSLAKVLENLEIGHNTMHGQWDWMNDPEIHSSTWEWDNSCPSSGWKHSHNFVHHKYTNVLGMDNDVGYGILRVTRDKKWTPVTLTQPIQNVILASLFQWAVAFYDVELGAVFAGKKKWEVAKPQLIEVLEKGGRQLLKDYALFPLLAGPRWAEVAKGNAVANLVRNVWAYAVIFCGHFPDDAETFTKDQYKNENKAEWYLRQMLGSANFHGGFILSVLSGNLNYQIEHHLYPDMPSNRLAAISKQVKEICRDYDLPYNTGSFPGQLLQVQRTILKLSLPDRFLVADPDNAPEVRSEKAFVKYPQVEQQLDATATPRRGLRTGLGLLKKLRPGVKDAIAAYTGRSTRTLDNQRAAAQVGA